MNKNFFRHYMETEPEGTAKKYIFLVDNQDIAMNIVLSDYQALYLAEEDDEHYFSVESFIDDMRSIQFHGTCQSAYHYVAACSTKWMNDRILEFCKDAGLDGKVDWQLFFENHEMQEEMQKSNAEIQQMTAELSEMRKLNQSLQQSNDDLRNRNGLMSRSEPEQLEEEIKDVRDRNSKLQVQVNKSSVEAVDQAQQKQEEAEKQAKQAVTQAEREKKRADVEIRRANLNAKRQMDILKEKEYFWGAGYATIILFSILKSSAFQRDLLDFLEFRSDGIVDL